MRSLLIALLLCASSFSNQLIQIRLDKDGSVTPPGDRVNVFVNVFSELKNPQLSVRAFELDTERMQSKPLVAQLDAPKEFKNEKGNLQIFRGLEATEDEQKVDVVFPYEYFDLKEGAHTIFYEVTGTHQENGKEVIDYVSHSRLTVVSVGEGERDSMIEAGEAAKYVYHPVEEEAFKIENGKATSIKVTVKKAFLDAAPSTGTKVDVKIPGKFERTEVTDRVKTFTAAASDFKSKKHRIIHFATNRNVVKPGGEAKDRFGSKIAKKVTYGAALVNIPVNQHKKGQLETATWFNHDPEKIFLVEAIQQMKESDFFKTMSEHDVLIFVHGFNTDFEEALLRASQLQHDLEFGGRMLAFSWPSHGKTNKYFEDEPNAEGSVQAMTHVLKALVLNEQGEPERKGKIHIIAHSMGSRVLIEALSRMDSDGVFPEDWRPFAKVIFAAPDVDLNRFASMIPRVVNLAEDVTQYYSKKDMALGVSKRFNNLDRAGLYPFFYEGLHTINVDNANSGFLSIKHTYFATQDPLLLDLNLQILRGLDPGDRLPPLAPKEELKRYPGFAHYYFPLKTR